MKYDTSIKKVLHIQQRENQNTIDTDNLKKNDLLQTQENFRKQVIVIKLLVGYDFANRVFDPNSNDGKGGYINPLVNIISGGPQNLNPNNGGMGD